MVSRIGNRYHMSSTRVEAKDFNVSQSTCRAYGSRNTTPNPTFLHPRLLVDEISKNLIRFPADNFDVNVPVLCLDVT